MLKESIRYARMVADPATREECLAELKREAPATIETFYEFGKDAHAVILVYLFSCLTLAYCKVREYFSDPDSDLELVELTEDEVETINQALEAATDRHNQTKLEDARAILTEAYELSNDEEMTDED